MHLSVKDTAWSRSLWKICTFTFPYLSSENETGSWKKTQNKPKKPLNQTHKPKPNTGSNSCVNLGSLSAFPLCCNSFLQLSFLWAFPSSPCGLLSSTLGISKNTSSHLLCLAAPSALSSLPLSPRFWLRPCSFPVPSFDFWQGFHVPSGTAEFGPSSRDGIYWWSIKPCPLILYLENGRSSLLVKECY